MDEDGKLYRGVFGTLPGQTALTRMLESSGYFVDIPPSNVEAIGARNFMISVLNKMEVFKYEEDRRELVHNMLERAMTRVVEEPKQETRRKR